MDERTHAASEQACWDKIELEVLESLSNIYGADSLEAANISNYLARVAESRVQYATAEQHARRAWEIMERLGNRCDGRTATSARLDALARIGTSLLGGGTTMKPKSGYRGHWIWPNAMAGRS